MYVTPGMFKAQRYGSDVSGLQDYELAAVLGRASNVVDGYCTIPLLPERHDFRGGSVSDERHTWRLPDGSPASSGAGMRRTYPYHWPILSVSAFEIRVSNTNVALNIDTSAVVIQNSERYLEIVTLLGATFGLFNAITMPNVFLATPIVSLDYTYGHRFTVTEPVYNTDGVTRKLFRTSSQWWLVDADHPVTVYIGGVVQLPSTYTLDADEGTILFSSAVSAGASVKVTYTHTLPDEIRDATGLVTRYELGQSALAAKGMAGVESLKIAELEISQRREPRGASGVVNANNLDRLVPEAADLLAGLKFYRMAA